MATIRSRVQGEMTVVENVNLRVWNVLAASKQRCEGQTIRRRYRRYHRVKQPSSAHDRSCGPAFNRFARRAEGAIVSARQSWLVDLGWLSINSNSSSQSNCRKLGLPWTVQVERNRYQSIMDIDEQGGARSCH